MNILGALKLKVILAIIIALLSINTYRLNRKIDNLDYELMKSKNNVEYYQTLASNEKDENRTLLLTIEEFKQSQDSVINRLNDVRDSLKIKDKELSQVVSNTTILTDTIVREIPIDRNFSVELKPNQLTTIKISRVDSMLTCIPEIYNHQDLFVLRKKVYRNKYKNFFQRLIHFDFKKDKIEKYQIVNSNDLMKVIDTRVINITE